MCVTNFMCILLENAVYATVCVSVSSHFGWQKNLSAKCFSCVFGSFKTQSAITESLKTDIQKSPCQSLKKISVNTFITSFISAYYSTAQDLAARINQN